MPERIDAEYLSEYLPEYLSIHTRNPGQTGTDLTRLTLPIGLESDTLRVHQYSFGKSPVNLIISNRNESLSFLQETARLIVKYCGIPVMVLDPAGVFAREDTPLHVCFRAPDDCAEVITNLAHTLTRRLTARDRTRENPLVVIITAYSTLRDNLPEEPRQELDHILQEISSLHNIIIILGEQAQDLGKTALTTWYKKHYPNTAGDYLWTGAGLREQYTLQTLTRPTIEQSTLSPGYGFSVTGGQPIRIKLSGINTQEQRS